jgi:hypothetical protein
VLDVLTQEVPPLKMSLAPTPNCPSTVKESDPIDSEELEAMLPVQHVSLGVPIGMTKGVLEVKLFDTV